jgi:hypothetical protein
MGFSLLSFDQASCKGLFSLLLRLGKGHIWIVARDLNVWVETHFRYVSRTIALLARVTDLYFFTWTCDKIFLDTRANEVQVFLKLLVCLSE